LQTVQGCTNDNECPIEKACLNGQCIDPCTLRGVCGENALCSTVLHQPRCSCPNCHVGRPDKHCIPEAHCEEITTNRPRIPNIVQCESNSDCFENLICSNGICDDPCANVYCEEFKKCVVVRHNPTCVCKFGFVVNENGELACAIDKKECFNDDDCESNLACYSGKCKNPCMVMPNATSPCPPDKSCSVQNHKPVCICLEDCNPTVSICLRDSGCPEGLACRNYQCVNPCTSALCAEDSPCYVEDHKPICKFCPPGFIKDYKNGCLKGKT
jgi:hypothetical protein